MVFEPEEGNAAVLRRLPETQPYYGVLAHRMAVRTEEIPTV